MHGSDLALGQQYMPAGASVSPGIDDIQPFYEAVKYHYCQIGDFLWSMRRIKKTES